MLWLRERGLRWVLQYGRQAYAVGGVRKFWGGLITEAVGGGKGLSDGLFEMAETAGVQVRYDTRATGLRSSIASRSQGRLTRGSRSAP